MTMFRLDRDLDEGRAGTSHGGGPMARHPSLQTIITTLDGEIRQVVQTPLDSAVAADEIDDASLAAIRDRHPSSRGVETTTQCLIFPRLTGLQVVGRMKTLRVRRPRWR